MKSAPLEVVLAVWVKEFEVCLAVVVEPVTDNVGSCGIQYMRSFDCRASVSETREIEK